MLSETNLSGYDYIIGAKHYFNINGQHVGFDRSASEVKAVIDEYFGGDGLKFAKKYYEELYELTKYNVDIVAHFDISGAAISRHLSLLREADLIRDSREGKFIYYDLNASVLEEILMWVSTLKGEKND